MAKIILKEIDEGGTWRVGVDTTLIKSHVGNLAEMLYTFKQFLICCGYTVDGELEIVRDDDA